MTTWQEIDAARTAWDETAPPANRAADLWRRTFAGPETPLEGMQVGWQEDATEWIVRILRRTQDAVAHDPDVDRDELALEVAEEAATLPTAQALAIVAELPDWVAHEPTEYAPPAGEVTVARIVADKLAEVARALSQTYERGMTDVHRL